MFDDGTSFNDRWAFLQLIRDYSGIFMPLAMRNTIDGKSCLFVKSYLFGNESILLMIPSRVVSRVLTTYRECAKDMIEVTMCVYI